MCMLYYQVYEKSFDQIAYQKFQQEPQQQLLEIKSFSVNGLL